MSDAWNGLVLGGLAFYMGRTRARKGAARCSMPLFVCAALDFQTAMAFGPPPSSDGAMAVTALVAYALLAGVIAWLEKGRISEPGSRAASGWGMRPGQVGALRPKFECDVA